MKKAIIISVLLFITSNLSFPQNNDLKDISFTNHAVAFNYYRYANKPLGKEYKTYNVKINAPNALISEYANRLLSVDGFDEDDKNADLSYVVDIAPFIFNDPVVKENVVNYKSGPETEYYISMEYFYDIKSTLINNHTGKPLDSYLSQTTPAKSPLSEPNPKRWSVTCKSKADADAYLSVNKMIALREKLTQNVLDEALKGSSSSFTYNYGTSYVKSSVDFNRLKDDDYYEYYFYLKQVCSLEKLINKRIYSMKDKEEEKFKSDINSVIAYFESMITKYATANPKVAQKFASTSYYNIGLIYYCLDDLDKSRDFAQKVIQTGENKKSGENLIKMIDGASENMAKNGKTNRGSK